MPPWEVALLGGINQLKSTVKHCNTYVKCIKMGGTILTVCMSYDAFLRKELPFGGRDVCICLKIY